MNNICGKCTCFSQQRSECIPRCVNIQPPKLQTLIAPKVCICGSNADYDYRRFGWMSCSKHPKLKVISLEEPIGIIQAPLLIKAETVADLISQRFATYLKAFANLILTNESEWNAAMLNFIQKEGQKLFLESKKLESPKVPDENERRVSYDVMRQSTSIYSESELKIKRSFEFLGNLYDIDLSGKLKAPENLLYNSEIGSESTLADAENVIKKSFKKKQHCLLEINGWYVMIWKSRGAYFVLDFCGRRRDTLESDKNSGVVMLICFKSLANVIFLLGNLSGLQRTDICRIREIKVARMVSQEGTFLNVGNEERENEYIVVSPDYAYLTSELHLTLKTQNPLRSRSALPIGIAVLLASKIDHPATWTGKILSRIICHGINVCRFCWENCLHDSKEINFSCFPNQFRMGQFLVSFCLQPIQFEGNWKCVPNIHNTDMSLFFTEFFEKSSNNILLQINQQIYAIWKKNEFIYLFDPYRHKIAASDNAPRSSTLRIFRTLPIFLNVLNYTLLQSNATSKFYIHKIQIKSIEDIDKKNKVSIGEKTVSNEWDLKSINDVICFVEDVNQYLPEFGQESEDDDEETFEEEELPDSELEFNDNEEEEHGSGVEDIE